MTTSKRFRIRNVSPADVDALFTLSHHLDSINLPHDRAHIADMVQASERAFANASNTPEGQQYMLIMEDIDTDKAIGTGLIIAQHGTLDDPHTYFDVLPEEHYSVSTKHYTSHTTLRLGVNFNGPTEMGGLVLHPDYRGHALRLGKCLSLSRFLLVAMRPERFRDRVLAEVMPPLKDDGGSHLWDAIGAKVTGMSYQAADILSRQNTEFIRSLFPRGNIYASFLPTTAQEVIGAVGPHAAGAARILKKMGLRKMPRVDPFDGGPHFEGETRQLLSTTMRCMGLPQISSADLSDHGIIAQTSPKGAPRFFRCAIGGFEPSPNDDTILISEQTHQILRTDTTLPISALSVV